ncbi:hypothetical protein [Vibrio harveyi]|uniref:hypothetical protein n=1 Tax=Vibrio harveyi TaxID=669 RepID=UPI00165E754D|nr:hypothetical protein [Vibrio harveyi]
MNKMAFLIAGVLVGCNGDSSSTQHNRNNPSLLDHSAPKSSTMRGFNGSNPLFPGKGILKSLDRTIKNAALLIIGLMTSNSAMAFGPQLMGLPERVGFCSALIADGINDNSWGDNDRILHSLSPDVLAQISKDQQSSSTLLLYGIGYARGMTDSTVFNTNNLYLALDTDNKIERRNIARETAKSFDCMEMMKPGFKLEEEK